MARRRYTIWTTGSDDEPACWSWAPVPVGTLVDLAAESWRRPGSVAWLAVAKWQSGRCAICGEPGRLLADHDHGTGLLRGFLCRPCNTSEGCYEGPVWWRYRERHPTLILGVTCQYTERIKDREVG